MMDRLLSDSCESGVLCQIWDEAVHFAVHLDVFHDFVAVSLQTAVHVMQADACNPSCGSIVYF